ncbi:UNVERIFIED_ORG: hypothetical protein DFO82_2400 [Idiomarina abyssalis]|uniref:hypothetical protein n=1 Tax=Idiomarina sp. 017G TaxID=2183988 RepID=UPI000E0E48AA|nr:hypothetical protein [Idiomarina sp. 017G]TDO46460.1 hypothetical protein DEU30_11035 [Idiomarina sp. 017G]
MKLNLLIVEDEDVILSNWREKLEFYSAEDGPTYSINPVFVKDLVEAEAALALSSFDAAVIDIRLKTDDGQANKNKDGNKIIETLTNYSLTVIAVYTGELGIVELEDSQKDFVGRFEKGEGVIDEILTWLDDKSAMILAIQEMQLSMREAMAKAFSKSIWPRWNHWMNQDNQGKTHIALTRHMATHLHASFLNNEGLGSHPEEYFFIPPLQESLDTGDIIHHEGKLEIIVTPRCDMVRSKSERPTYQLVTLSDKAEKWDQLVTKLDQQKQAQDRKKTEKAEKELIKFTNHNGETSSHFIQRFRKDIDGEERVFGPFYAQFNLLRSIDRTNENIEFLMKHRVASLSNEFVPSLVERLGAYFSRIGTPDYSHPD